MELALVLVKKLGTEHGKPPLVCPIDGTSLVRPGRGNRTAKGEAVRIALRFELPLLSVLASTDHADNTEKSDTAIFQTNVLWIAWLSVSIAPHAY